MNAPRIRPADRADGAPVRELITRTLLEMGFDAPDGGRDPDLLEPGYYEVAGRGLWVASNGAALEGCIAIDRGDPGIAVLRRAAGDPLDGLVDTAVAFARDAGYEAIEAVVPPGMEQLRSALLAAQFVAEGPGNALLYRRVLRSGSSGATMT